MKRISVGIALFGAAYAFMVSVPVGATVVWTSTTGTCTGSHSTNTTTTVYDKCNPSTPSGAPGATVTAVSNTGTGGQLAGAYVGAYSGGYGATSAAGPTSSPANTQETTVQPDHALDNNGNYEALLLTFTAPVALNEVQLGYYSSDSDISVLAYTGNGSPSLLGSTWSAVANAINGWTLIGNFANVWGITTNGHSNSVAMNGGATPVSSSYWLIGAYNSAFGTTNSSGTGALGTGNDYVKVLAAYGNVRPPSGQTPEPSSMLLLGIGLLSLTALYRRRTV
jgi:hypothetical protein